MAMLPPRSRRISASLLASRSSPSKRTWPPTMRPPGSGTRRRIDRHVIDLPEPDSPTMPSVSPRPTENVAPSTAFTTPRRVWMYVRRSRTSRSGSGFTEAGQHVLREQLESLHGFGVRHEARSAPEHQILETSVLLLKLHDLPVDGVRIPREEKAARHGLLLVDPDQRGGIATRGGHARRSRGRRRCRAIERRRERWRRLAGEELRILWRRSQPG